MSYNVPDGGGSSPYNADVRVVGVSANIVFPLPISAIVARPYVIGGVGMYNVRYAPTTGGSSSASNVGFNIGAGVKVSLVVVDAFVAARYHQVQANGGHSSFVPITVGVMF